MQKLLSTPILLIAGLLASPIAVAQPGSHWLEVKTAHFAVLTNSGERDARHAAVQFERMRAVFHVLVPSATDDPASPIEVLELKDKKSMRLLEPEAYLAKNQIELAGLFVQTPDRNYILVREDAEGEHPFDTVYHEYTHYMFRKYYAWMPLWLNEGMAEFFQNTQIQDKDVRIGQPSADDILYLRQNKLIPLATLLTVDHDSPFYHDEQKGSIFYAESWALTHYLMINDKHNNTHLMADYWTALQKNQDSLTAAEHAFGDLKKLEKELDYYVSRMSFSELKLLSPVDLTESSIAVRPVPDAEADAIRAGVLMSVQRQKDAEALLSIVLQADPNNALAHETMGSLKFQQRDLSGAKKWYGEAVQLDSKSYLANYYFGVISLQEGDRNHDDAVEKSLRSSIELNPKFAPAYDALAEFYSSRHEKLDEAHALNTIAIQLEPETLNYRLNAANVLAENQQSGNAIKVLKAAMPYTKIESDKQMVQSRIADLQRYVDAVEASKQQSQREVVANKVVSTIQVNADKTLTISAAEAAPEYPAGDATGPHHTITGVLQDVTCDFAVLTLTVNRPAGPVVLYTNNYYKVTYSTLGYISKEAISPCHGIEGMKAKVEYAEVSDKRVAGQIMSIELTK
jgi:tetratricopeptide (TPR) repeat protein